MQKKIGSAMMSTGDNNYNYVSIFNFGKKISIFMKEHLKMIIINIRSNATPAAVLFLIYFW